MEPGDAGTKLEKSDDLLALGQRGLFPILLKQGSVSTQYWGCLCRHQAFTLICFPLQIICALQRKTFTRQTSPGSKSGTWNLAQCCLKSPNQQHQVSAHTKYCFNEQSNAHVCFLLPCPLLNVFCKNRRRFHLQEGLSPSLQQKSYSGITLY